MSGLFLRAVAPVVSRSLIASARTYSSAQCRKDAEKIGSAATDITIAAVKISARTFGAVALGIVSAGIYERADYYLTNKIDQAMTEAENCAHVFMRTHFPTKTLQNVDNAIVTNSKG